MTVNNSERMWDFFVALPQAQQRFLIDNSGGNPFKLEADVMTLLGRPPRTYRHPGNDEQLWEEAGKSADEYHGEGWMALRSIIWGYHKRMRKLGI